MGGGSWSDKAYRSAVKGRKAFDYSDDVLARPKDKREPHQLLNPYGLGVRESRDSAEHPRSNAAAVGLDVTGSMDRVVVEIQSSLGNLMAMLLENGYLTDPQLMFYAVGDATCDDIPFQISQFESDIRINDQLTKVVLEGGGGGQNTESYELGFYAMEKHTSIDCFEKRGRKGYLFTIGDEFPYPAVKKREAKKIFNADIQSDIPLEEVVKSVEKKYNIFHIIPAGSNNYSNKAILNAWRKLLGQECVFLLSLPEATAETIALAIGLAEGTADFEQGLNFIKKKSGASVSEAVRKALETFAEYAKKLPKAPKVKTAEKEKKTAGKKEDKKGRKKEKEDWEM